MKYKIGDRVRVKTNLKGGEHYGDRYFSPDMEEYRGKEYTVIAIDKRDYYLEGVRRPYGPWSWNDEMLEPAILPVKRDWTLIVRPDKADPNTTVAILKVDGKETRHESVKRYHKDEYGIEAAIKAVMAKIAPSKPEPVKVEPIMIGNRELKVGSKFILKPHGEVDNHHGVSKSDWDDEFGKILVISKVYASATPPYIDTENGCYCYCCDAIDRILED